MAEVFKATERAARKALYYMEVYCNALMLAWLEVEDLKQESEIPLKDRQVR